MPLPSMHGEIASECYYLEGGKFLKTIFFAWKGRAESAEAAEC